MAWEYACERKQEEQRPQERAAAGLKRPAGRKKPIHQCTGLPHPEWPQQANLVPEKQRQEQPGQAVRLRGRLEWAGWDCREGPPECAAHNSRHKVQ